MEDSRIVRGRHRPEKQVLARRMRRWMTASETLLWHQLHAKKFEGLHFRRQQLIDGFIADFYCHTARLVIEVDGAAHENQVEYDAERDRIIAQRGLRIIRITNAQIENDLTGVLEVIRKMIYSDAS